MSSNGEAKFRANGTWDVNWGAAAEFSGQGTQEVKYSFKLQVLMMFISMTSTEDMFSLKNN